jgi:hypothetical protein
LKRSSPQQAAGYFGEGEYSQFSGFNGKIYNYLHNVAMCSHWDVDTNETHTNIFSECGTSDPPSEFDPQRQGRLTMDDWLIILITVCCFVITIIFGKKHR